MGRRRVLTIAAAALSFTIVGMFLGWNTRGVPPKKPIERSTDTINLSAVTDSNQAPVFHEVNRAGELPGAVLDTFRDRNLDKSEQLAGLPPDKAGGIADPGEPFNTNDVVDPNLPMRQLVAGAVSERYCIVSYWQGGIALIFQTSIFELSESKAKLIWLSEAQGGFNFRDLKWMVESGRMRNDYWLAINRHTTH